MTEKFPSWYLRFCMILAFISGLTIGGLLLWLKKDYVNLV